MTIPVKGQIVVQLGPGDFDFYDIQYNPTELTFDKQAQLAEIEDENTRLQYEVEAFENPLNLIELARKPEYRALKHPLSSEILITPVEQK